MKMLKFQTELGKALYVPIDHLVSVYASGDDWSTITLSNRTEWDVSGPCDWIIDIIMKETEDESGLCTRRLSDNCIGPNDHAAGLDKDLR